MNYFPEKKETRGRKKWKRCGHCAFYSEGFCMIDGNDRDVEDKPCHIWKQKEGDSDSEGID